MLVLFSVKIIRFCKTDLFYYQIDDTSKQLDSKRKGKNKTK